MPPGYQLSASAAEVSLQPVGRQRLKGTETRPAGGSSRSQRLAQAHHHAVRGRAESIGTRGGGGGGGCPCWKPAARLRTDLYNSWGAAAPPALQAVAGRSPRRGLRRGRASLRGATGAFGREQPAALPGRAGRGGPSGGTAFRPEITGIRLRRGQSGSSFLPQGRPRSGSTTPPADGGVCPKGQLRGLQTRRGNSRFFTEPCWISKREVVNNNSD